MLNKFLNDEAGAVTIDWVALTAGILLLGIAVVYGIFQTGVAGLAAKVNSNLQNTAIGTPAGISTPPPVSTFGAGLGG